MELDDYKIVVKQIGRESFSPKALPDIADYMQGQTQSIVGKIKRNLKLEIAFAGLFLVFDLCMLVFFSQIFYLRLFTMMLLIFCICFIYYVAKLLRYIQVQYTLDASVNEQLAQYIHIISRFTRLYFQLTMVMIPLILFMAFITGYLDQDQSGNFSVLFSSQTILIYLSLSAAWSLVMYFFTKWYIKKMYGNHLNKLKEQLRELQEVK